MMRPRGRPRTGRPAAGGAVLDGFPRTVAQAQALDRMLEQQSRVISVVINLCVPDAVVRQRILERANAEGRADDTEEAFARRIWIYREQTAPVLDYYKQTRTGVEVIDGVGTIEDVSSRILTAVKSVNGQPV